MAKTLGDILRAVLKRRELLKVGAGGSRGTPQGDETVTSKLKPVHEEMEVTSKKRKLAEVDREARAWNMKMRVAERATPANVALLALLKRRKRTLWRSRVMVEKPCTDMTTDALALKKVVAAVQDWEGAVTIPIILDLTQERLPLPAPVQFCQCDHIVRGGSFKDAIQLEDNDDLQAYETTSQSYAWVHVKKC